MPAVFKGMVGTWRTSQQRHEVCYLWRGMQRDLLFFMHTYYTILNWQVFVFWWASPRHCLTFMICSLDSQNKKRTCLREKTWSIHIRRRFPDPGSRQLQYWKRWQYFTANIGSEGSQSHLRSKKVQESWEVPFGKYNISAETLTGWNNALVVPKLTNIGYAHCTSPGNKDFQLWNYEEKN